MKLITLFFQTVGGKSIGRLVNGIAVRESKIKGKNPETGELEEKTEYSVQLGHYGTGQWCAKVGMLRKEPPIVKSGKVFNASLVALPNTKKQLPEDPSIFYVLALKTDDADTRILVRVNTEGKYKEGAIGAYPKGEDELPHGWGRHTGPDGGGESFWHDGLVTMAPGDLLPVQPEGGAPEDVIGLYFDANKGLGIVSVAEYQRLVAQTIVAPTVIAPKVSAPPAPVVVAIVTSGPASPVESATKKPRAKSAKAKVAAQTAE
ncbi:MAG: hypothetical protein AAB920_00705 [Patescibacteria group bacterium]